MTEHTPLLRLITGLLGSLCWITLWTAGAGAVTLPAGERTVQMAWHLSDSMILLVEEGQSYALRRLELSTGEFSVIQAPPAFTKLKASDGSNAELAIALAPTGSALAVLEKYDSPLNSPELSVYLISEDELEPLNTSRIPTVFYPELMAWSSDGQRLYLSAQEYLFPDQPYSIGAIDISSERFSGVALKANIDLIDALEYAPVRSELVALCRGFHGDYPMQPMIVAINTNGVARILHSQAANHRFHAMASGAVLVDVDILESSDEAKELWILDPAADHLRSADSIFDGPVTKMEASADGLWIGMLVGASELDMPEASEDEYLVLQRTADGKTVVTAEACSSFAFSPTGAQVCAVGADGSNIEFYNLPE